MAQLQPASLIQQRYRVVGLLAQGGMGAVYEAIDLRLGNTVALKQTLVADPQLRAAFEREARLLAALHHPALPVVSDHFIEEHDQFLVMQFIPGDDLARLLEQRGTPFPVDQVLGWADDLLDALEYLHSRIPPVIHRDIKPQNLKIGPRGRIVLLDFGLAKGSAAPGASLGSQSIFGYTPQYAPLEQIHGTGTDQRSDLHALAATLYQLLTGQAPPDALSRAAATVAGRADPLLPAQQLNPLIPVALGELLSRALAQNPDQRPGSAAAMRAALRSTLSTTPLGAGFAAPAPAPVNSSGQATVIVGGQAAGFEARNGIQGAYQAPLSSGGRAPVGRLVLAGIATALLLAILVAVAVAAGVTISDSSGGPATAATAITASSDPPVQGVSRADPVPAGEPVKIPGWQVRVIEVIRGQEAWSVLNEANQFNDPAPAGYEYLLVQFQVQAAFSGETRQLLPKITGEQRIERLPVAAVTPEPRFPDGQVEGGSSFTGWLPYLIPEGETNLMLRIEELIGPSDSYGIYLALDQEARIVDDPALRALEPTAPGRDQREPALPGETARSEDWEVTVLEVVRGAPAMERLLEANQFNDPPGPGMEYALVRLAVRYIGPARNDEAVLLSSSAFKSLPPGSNTPEADLINSPSVVEPEPAISAYFFPGGHYEGWVTVEVPRERSGALLVFQSGFDLNNLNTRYFALE